MLGFKRGIKGSIHEDFEDLSSERFLNKHNILNERVLVDSSRFDPSKYKFFREYYTKRPMGRKLGYAMFVRLKNFEDVLDTYGDYHFLYDGKNSIRINKIMRKVWDEWRDEIENNTMQFMVDHLEGMNENEFYSEIDPDDIVDSAGLWDINGFVAWFWDKYEYPAIELSDGAIVFDRKLIDIIPVDKDGEFLEKISEYVYT